MLLPVEKLGSDFEWLEHLGLILKDKSLSTEQKAVLVDCWIEMHKSRKTMLRFVA